MGGRGGRCFGCGPLAGGSRRVERVPRRGRDDIAAVPTHRIIGTRGHTRATRPSGSRATRRTARAGHTTDGRTTHGHGHDETTGCAGLGVLAEAGYAGCPSATAADASSRPGPVDSTRRHRLAAGASPHFGVPRRRCPDRRRARAGHRGALIPDARAEPDVDNPGHQGCPVAGVRRELTTRNNASTTCHAGMRVSGQVRQPHGEVGLCDQAKPGRAATCPLTSRVLRQRLCCWTRSPVGLALLRLSPPGEL